MAHEWNRDAAYDSGAGRCHVVPPAGQPHNDNTMTTGRGGDDRAVPHDHEETQ